VEGVECEKCVECVECVESDRSCESYESERREGREGRIHLLAKIRYGKLRIYADCPFSDLFTKVTNTACLSMQILEVLKDYGFELFYTGERSDKLSKIATYNVDRHAKIGG
jgi:hypothetical protein